MPSVKRSLVRRMTREQSFVRYIDRCASKAMLLLLGLMLFRILYTHGIFSIGTSTTTAKPFWIDLSRAEVAAYVEKLLADSLKLDKGMGCDIPDLDPFANEASVFDEEIPPLVCEGQDWVKCNHSKCRILHEVTDFVTDISCEFRDILYVDDFTYKLGPITVVTKESDYVLNASDYAQVICLGNNVTSGEIVTWLGVVIGFRPVKPSQAPPGRERTNNVVIFLFDSTSKSGFIRLMPQSWKVLNEELGATVMHGFNIVGDGTISTLLPMLTGKTELENPDVRRRSLDVNVSVDDLPFIFYKLKRDGYRTAYFEDMPIVGAFQFRFKGFKRQPTDHYLPAVWQAYKRLFDTKQWNYCLGDTPQYRVMMNITEQFMELGGKRFIVSFVTDITHENLNTIQWADEDTASFLRRLKKYAEDTLIVVMGDHGPRYSYKYTDAEIRAKYSIRGKQDERLPLLAIRLPSRSARRAQHALEANARVLVTPHDVHATLLHVLGMQSHWNPYRVPGAELKRGLTLLEPIPRNRSCSEAGIGTHWCTCLVWQNVPASNPLYHKSAEALISYINWMVQTVRSQCVPRTLESVRWVLRQRVNKDLLSYSGGVNYDSYLARYDFNTTMPTEHFQISVVAGPGQANYEASLTYYLRADQFMVVATDITRINAYKGESDCIAKTHPHLVAYCYCQRRQNPELEPIVPYSPIAS